MVRKVSVILPALNEAESIASLIPAIQRVAAERQRSDIFEIVVVDDGSTDGTGDVAARAGARVVRHPYNIGNGAAIKSGIRAASGELLLFMDADGQHDPADVERLVSCLADYDMAVGARTKQASPGRAIGNRIYNLSSPPHAGGDPAGTLALGFDAAVTGEGEEAFPELVRACGAGRPAGDGAGPAPPPPGRRGAAHRPAPPGGAGSLPFLRRGAPQARPDRDLARPPSAAPSARPPTTSGGGCATARRRRWRATSRSWRPTACATCASSRRTPLPGGRPAPGAPTRRAPRTCLTAVHEALPRPGRIFFGSLNQFLEMFLGVPPNIPSSLRDAVIFSNADPGTDTITFAAAPNEDSFKGTDG